MTEMFFVIKNINNKNVNYKLKAKIDNNKKPIDAAKILFNLLYNKKNLNNIVFNIRKIDDTKNKVYGPYIGKYENINKKIIVKKHIIQKGGDYVKSSINININSHYAVKAVSISKDGKKVVAGLGNNVIVCDTVTGDYIKILEGHTNFINSTSFSNNGQYVVSGSKDNTIRVWDLCTGNCNYVFLCDSPILSVSISSDNKYIASSCKEDTIIRIWNIIDNKIPVKEINTEHLAGINSVSINYNGTLVASGSFDKSVRIFDVNTGNNICKFENHTDVVNSVSFSGNGRYIASGSKDKTVKVWDVVKKRCLRNFELHSSEVNTVSFNDNSTMIVSGDKSGYIMIWHLVDNIRIDKFKERRNISSISISSNGLKIAACMAGMNKIIILGEPEVIHKYKLAKVHNEFINTMKEHPCIKEYINLKKNIKKNNYNFNYNYNKITNNNVKETIDKSSNKNLNSIIKRSMIGRKHIKKYKL